MKLSIIIVNYNTKTLTMQAINSVIQTVENINYEIILVDNSTTHNQRFTDNLHARVQVFSTENKGYANANNLGISHANGEYILLLNPDTIVYKDSINKCLEKLENNKNIGALGCRVIRPNGTLDHACRRGFPTPFNSFCYFTRLYKVFAHNPKFCKYTYSHQPETVSCEVDSLTGAFMLIPRHVLNDVGTLDETFFMYGEDIDLCYRIKSAGYCIFYYADYSILHKKYQSGIAKSSPFVIKQFYKSMILFYDKHYRNKYFFITRWCVYLGIYSIMGMKLFKNKITDK